MLHFFGVLFVITSFDVRNFAQECSEGSLDNPLIGCTPECGKVIKYTTGQHLHTESNEFPWHVGIYRLEDGKHQYRCGGSIISPLIILTNAEYFANVNGNKYPAQEFYVAAGKLYSDYNAIEDNYDAQKRQVKEFHVPPEFSIDSNYTGDLTVVVLVKAFEMTSTVGPVCVDWAHKIEDEQFNNNKTGSIVGWGHGQPRNNNVELRRVNIPYRDRAYCLYVLSTNFRRWVTPDKFCAGHTNGTGVCGDDIGGGLVFKWTENNTQKFYILGVLSRSAYRGGQCNRYHYAVYTRISAYYDFILNIISSLSSKSGDFCQVINLPNGKYEVAGEKIHDGSRPIPNYASVKLSCNTQYALYPPNAWVTCVDGNWNIPLSECRRTCPPRISSTVDVTCTVDGTSVDCTQPLVEGTLAKSKCKRFYTKSGPEIPISTCSGSFWNNPLIRCVPECGEVVSDGTPQVINGTNVKKGEFPWHIGLYRYQGEKHEYQCGGSIITPVITLSAAHCFTDELGTERFPAKEFYVGAGKYYSDYNAEEDKLAQRTQVKEYHIPPQYRGYESSYAGDLAVVVLVEAFQLTDVVQPVCVEWENRIEPQQLKSNNRGRVVGWGYMDPNKPQASAELKQLNAPYIDVGTCLDGVPNNFRRWVTTDKFCAGFTNGSSVCRGDSGGGMVFEWTENNRQKYYIRGLVSVGPKLKGTCDNFQYGVYTKISAYYDFILQIISSNIIRD